MVFQSYALYPAHDRGPEHGLRPARGRPPPRPRSAPASKKSPPCSELTPLLDRLPAQMSGGQRQRVAMGRAIVRQPAVFLFDEPLSNLDASLRTHMRVELKRLHKRLGATILHVTHDQVEALTLADRILVLNQGVVQQFGSPRAALRQPRQHLRGAVHRLALHEPASQPARRGGDRRGASPRCTVLGDGEHGRHRGRGRVAGRRGPGAPAARRRQPPSSPRCPSPPP